VRSPGNAAAGVGLALLSAATFGTSGSFATALLDAGWTPDAVVIARISIAAALLAVPAAVALRRSAATLRAATAPTLIYGVVAVGGAQVCFFNAVKYVPVGVALLLEYLGIVLVVAWMWIRHRQRPRQLTVAGLAVVLVGLSFVLDLFGSAHLNVVGVLWGLGAAVGLAAYFVLSAHSSDRLPPITMACGGLAVGAVALVAVGVVGILPLHATFGTVSLAHHHMSWLVPIAGLSVLAAAVAYVAGIHAARRLGPKLSSFVGLTEVLFAVLFAWVLLGQLPTAAQGIGAVLIITGIVLVRLDESAEVPEQAIELAESDGPAREKAVELA
jgi:drug/metabolite transporter (DMT)-like permease